MRSVTDMYMWGKILSWRKVIGGLILILLTPSLVLSEENGTHPATDSMVLEDFRDPDENGFPKGWDAQRSKTTAKETYQIRQEDTQAFFEAKDANQRVYTKQISWDPQSHPILTWRWRVRSVPKEGEFIAAVYPSLDVDFMFIPVNTKYVWSLNKEVGTVIEGGMFGSTEMVIRSGPEPIGEWVEEKVNVYEDFLRVHNHEPAPKAWGISILGGPGVEVDFGSLEVHKQ